jgi:hypothetical protein
VEIVGMEYEIWKAVVGYEGLYEVSNMGRVRSLDRKYDKFWKGKIVNGFSKGTILVGNINKRRYKYFVLCKIGEKRKSAKCHIMVMESFCGPRPDGMVIDHINHDSTDNRLCNLQYITQTDNIIRGRNSALKEGKTSNYAGVHKQGRRVRWCATKSWRHNGKKMRLNIGLFDNEKEAHKAYLAHKDMSIEDLNRLYMEKHGHR